MATSHAELLAGAGEGELSLVATLLVLCEIAHSDKDYDASERTTIAGSLESAFGVTGDRVAALLAEAESTRTGSPDLAHLSRLIHKELPEARDRRAVVAAMWRVVMADGNVDPMEERLANSVSMLLGIGFADVARIREEL